MCPFKSIYRNVPLYLDYEYFVFHRQEKQTYYACIKYTAVDYGS